MGRVRRAAAVLALSLTALWAPSATARPPAALYYETQTGPQAFAIDELDLSTPMKSTQVVDVGDVNVFGLALGGPYIYWTTESGPQDRGMIMRASLDGEHVRRLVGDLASPDSLITVDGRLYWNDQDAIGRVALDGSHLVRRFMNLPQEPGGGVADGLASDGTHLFFSRCQNGTIGRADLNGTHVEEQFIALSAKTCPQGLAIAGDYIYWTQLGSGTIGRARLNGSDIDGLWLNIHSDQGPFQVVADSAEVYWTWGGVDGSLPFTGRAGSNGTHLDRAFLPGSLYPMVLSAAVGSGT